MVTPSVIPEGVWSQVVVVVHGAGNMVAYVNGTELSGLIFDGTGDDLAHNSAPARMGRNSAGGTYFRGAIDEFYIYNRALDPSEIPPLTVPVTTTSWGEVKSLFH